jgi:hypothetical protein
MTTCRDVVTRCFRKTGDLEQTERPGGPMEDAGMVSLQAMYDGWANSGLLGALQDVLIDADQEAEENKRYTASEEVTVTLPASIQDSQSPTGYRSPREGALVILALGDPQEVWRYDSRSAEWVALHELELADAAPRASFGLDGLASCLAMQVASDTGRELSQATALAAANFRAALAGRWHTQRAGLEAEYF